MTGQFQNHINGLRALAVIGVVLFHFQLFGIDSGFVGVDVFFVISGYLMTRILFEKESISKTSYFTEFWVARIRRIAPALVVLTLVCLCVFTTLLLYPDYKKFLRSNVTANLFLSNYFFLGQSNYFDTEADNNPLLHTWSLSVEWQFYLIYPFVIYLLRERSFAIKLATLAALMVASYAYCCSLTNTDSTRAYFELMPRVWEFLAGGVVYLVSVHQDWFAKVQTSLITHVSGLLSLCAVLTSMVWVEKSIFPGWIAALPVIAATLLILNGHRGVVHVFLSAYPLQIIGNLSYSLYLWHWPIYVYFGMAVAVDNPLSTLEKLTALLISLGASYVSYKWIEQPIRKKSSHWSSKKVIGFWVASILISIVALGVVLKSSEASYRLPVYLANAEKARVDKNPRQDECFLDGGMAAARNNDPLFCRIGVNPSNSTDAILWGDSFADAIQPMVEKLLTANNLSGVVSTLAGCLPINKVAYVDDAMKRQFSHCDKGLNQKVFEFITQTPTLKYVIMTANWRRYDTDVLNRDVVQQVCKLKALNRTPILIGPVPSPNYDVPRLWGRMELKQREIVDSMVFPLDSSRNVENIFNKLIERIESSCGAVLYVMPSQTYCEKGNCYAVKNGNALFVDNAHLSRTGALMMQDQLETVLLKNINH